MQSGIDKKSIKIKNSSIYIQEKLHGSVQNSFFCPVDQPPADSDRNLEPSSISHSHSNSNDTTTFASADDTPSSTDTPFLILVIAIYDRYLFITSMFVYGMLVA